MGLLSGKTVLITGAGRGIGRAVAERFAAEGATLFLAVRNIEQGMLLAGELQADHGIDCHAFTCDVSDADSVKALFRELFAHSKHLDVLVNNAGGSTPNATLANPNLLQEFDFVMKLNLRSVVQLTQLAVPFLEKSKGNIVNISSVASTSPVSILFHIIS